MSKEHIDKAIGQHWDARRTNPVHLRDRWWKSPRIVAHINHMICGKSFEGVNEGSIYLIKDMLEGKSFGEALSLGCGGAHKELEFVKQGLVQHFYLYELSRKNCELAKQRFESAGCGDRVTIINKDFFETQPRKFDLIHWDNSLHHMFNARDAIAQTFDCLRPGGVFYMNDFVGSSRFQWSEAELEQINFFRKNLPDEIFINPLGGKFPRRAERPSLKQIIAADPSEAADSASIIPALEELLPSPKIIPTGGTIYHTALNDILVNIDEDSPLLTQALKIDEAITKRGFFQYAVCLAGKG
ncbi:class I SAM-dependent methyltransferase [Desulfovibrio sp. JC022]|uniref:class I SAM-dependent methyltransferase n=1 Tax=Desulfovibrio sp. JC022 TaxID=2593642 RepID=UPI0013D773A2|nr:class I SAM-dependent methyltransferase [Desulfovibrio sp. JC022]NDV22862.1 class I SAM-dependent methyltransferase [Desulfovibrio sp. JC022]